MNSMFSMSQGAGQKLEFAFQRNDGTTSDLDWLSTGENLRSAILLARGEAELIIKVSVPVPDPVLDFLVRVDRSVKPGYPNYFKKLEYPKLECSGPAEYDLQTAVQEWLANGQRRSVVKGDCVYTQLKKDNVFASCLNLQDGLAIQQKGIAVFRKLFAGKAVFLWGSVMQDLNSLLLVPCLCEDGDEVVVLWRWLDCNWNSRNPALRFSKN